MTRPQPTGEPPRSSGPGRHRRWSERPWLLFLTAAAAILLLALAERGVRTLVAEREPGRGAAWIWAPGVVRKPAARDATPEPVAFFASRDLELEAALPASISITADEGYTLYVNGHTVGGNTFRQAAAIDRYRIGGLLRSGRNRITVGLHSLRGAGGLLAVLAAETPDAGDRVLLRTDGAWRIFHHLDGALFRPDAPLVGGEAPKVWQRAPTGRWRPRPAAGDRPLVPGGDRPTMRFPRRARNYQPGTPWVDAGAWWRTFPVKHPRVLIDWGREVEGFLTLRLASPMPPSTRALAYFGDRAPDPETRPADQVLLFVAGQKGWRDLHPRRFRYLLLVGTTPLDQVSVQTIDGDLAARLAPPPADGAGDGDGVFGLRPPRRSQALETAVWERLRRAAKARRAAGGPVAGEPAEAR